MKYTLTLCIIASLMMSACKNDKTSSKTGSELRAHRRLADSMLARQHDFDQPRRYLRTSNDGEKAAYPAVAWRRPLQGDVRSAARE